MNEKMLILERKIDKELQTIGDIYDKIGVPIQIVVDNAIHLKKTYPGQFQKFIVFLRTFE